MIAVLTGKRHLPPPLFLFFRSIIKLIGLLSSIQLQNTEISSRSVKRTSTKPPPPGSDNHLLVILAAFWSQGRNHLFLFYWLFHEISCNYTLPRLPSDVIIYIYIQFYHEKSLCSVWCWSITTRLFSLFFILKQPFNHPNKSLWILFSLALTLMDTWQKWHAERNALTCWLELWKLSNV